MEIPNKTLPDSVAQCRSRRLVSFSLRSLLCVMLICAVGAGWFAIRMRSAKRQQELVQRFLDQGVRVVFDHQFSRRRGVRRRRKSVPPGWARKLLGQAFFSKVHALYASEPNSATELSDIQYLRDLRQLYINDTGANDATLEYIARSPEVEALYIGGTQVTDAGIVELAKLHKLSSLVVWDTAISDIAMDTISTLPALKVLSLHGTAVTDHAVLRIVNSHLRFQLRELNLSGTLVSRDAYPMIAKIDGLRRLSVRELRVNDDDLQLFVNLKRLEFIDLYGTDVTPAGVDAFHAACPTVTIHGPKTQ